MISWDFGELRKLNCFKIDSTLLYFSCQIPFNLEIRSFVKLKLSFIDKIKLNFEGIEHASTIRENFINRYMLYLYYITNISFTFSVVGIFFRVLGCP